MHTHVSTCLKCGCVNESISFLPLYGVDGFRVHSSSADCIHCKKHINNDADAYEKKDKSGFIHISCFEKAMLEHDANLPAPHMAHHPPPPSTMLSQQFTRQRQPFITQHPPPPRFMIQHPPQPQFAAMPLQHGTNFYSPRNSPPTLAAQMFKSAAHNNSKTSSVGRVDCPSQATDPSLYSSTESVSPTQHYMDGASYRQLQEEHYKENPVTSPLYATRRR